MIWDMRCYIKIASRGQLRSSQTTPVQYLPNKIITAFTDRLWALQQPQKKFRLWFQRLSVAQQQECRSRNGAGIMLTTSNDMSTNFFLLIIQIRWTAAASSTYNHKSPQKYYLSTFNLAQGLLISECNRNNLADELHKQ